MCFNLATLEQLLIWVVLVIAIVSILKLLIPWVLSNLGMAGGIIAQIINIALWTVVAIIVIKFAFTVISCLSGSAHIFSLPH